jgi:nitrous oxide reductase accessory protein NosL
LNKQKTKKSNHHMKTTRRLALIAFIALMAATLAGPLAVRAADSTNTITKPIPYPLDTCAVCGMKLGEMGEKPYTFVYQGREIKVCDKSEEADFKKEPAKYLKAIDEAAAKLKDKK